MDKKNSKEKDEECTPKSSKTSKSSKPKKARSGERLCPADINPCTLLEDFSKKAGGSKDKGKEKEGKKKKEEKTCLDNNPEDVKKRLKRDHELACMQCPKKTCRETDLLFAGGKCEEEDPKKKKKK